MKKTSDIGVPAQGPDEALMANMKVKQGRSNKMPPQIKYIVGNEACERFSFYGMRTILVVYMVHYLNIAEPHAKGMYHLFVSACYLLPLLGGFLADRYLGKYKTIMWLSLFYCFGHGVLALWDGKVEPMYLGLGLIALGAGGIKPCVSAHVGDQFNKTNSHLIKRVYDWFYWSINFGALFSSLITPWLLKNYGPGPAFGLPGILMFLATVIFWLGRKQYNIVPPTGKNGNGFMTILFHSLKNLGSRKKGQSILDVAKDKYPDDAVEGAKAVLRVGMIFLTICMFWSLYDQNSSSWVLMAEHMELGFMGVNIDPSQIQALNPLMIMILIPVFGFWLYPMVEKMGVKVTPLRKMATGMYLTTFSFILVALFQYLLDQGVKLNVMWLSLPFLIVTMSEVMISITGLEFAYTQSPRAMKSTIMSLWLLTIFGGNLFTAWISEINVFKGVTFFIFFAAMMAAVSVVFMFQTMRFKTHSYLEE